VPGEPRHLCEVAHHSSPEYDCQFVFVVKLAAVSGEERLYLTNPMEIERERMLKRSIPYVTRTPWRSTR